MNGIDKMNTSFTPVKLLEKGLSRYNNEVKQREKWKGRKELRVVKCINSSYAGLVFATF